MKYNAYFTILTALFFSTCSILLDSDGHIKLTGVFLGMGANTGVENGLKEGKRREGGRGRDRERNRDREKERERERRGEGGDCE